MSYIFSEVEYENFFLLKLCLDSKKKFFFKFLFYQNSTRKRSVNIVVCGKAYLIGKLNQPKKKRSTQL